jgi:hypothetical protein
LLVVEDAADADLAVLQLHRSDHVFGWITAKKAKIDALGYRNQTRSKPDDKFLGLYIKSRMCRKTSKENDGERCILWPEKRHKKPPTDD